MSELYIGLPFIEVTLSILLPRTSQLLYMHFYSTNTRFTTRRCHVALNMVPNDSPAHLQRDLCPLFPYDTVYLISLFCKERLSFHVIATRVQCSSSAEI